MKLWLSVVAALGLAGCSDGQATAPATSSTTTTLSATSTTVTPRPTLGQLRGVFAHGKSFGQVEPSEIYNGGDPTGRVQHVVWTSWGEPKAGGTGKSDYVAPNQDVAEGTEELATVTAFKLGTCDGRLMYQAVEWYFPQHGQSFDPNRYQNICTGTYVADTTTAASRCLPGQIKAGNGPRIGGANEEGSLSLTLTNRGPAPCVLDGYPRVRLVTSAGTVLDLAQVAHSSYVTMAGPRPVLLGVGATAFVVVAQFACVTGELQVAAQVRLTLPEAVAGPVFRVRIVRSIGALALCKGGPSDRGNVIAVTPVEATLAATVQ